jgi:hypothetical protein
MCFLHVAARPSRRLLPSHRHPNAADRFVVKDLY